MRIFTSLPGNFKIDQNVHKLLEQELREGFNKISTYRQINLKVNKLRVKLVSLLQQLKKQEKKKIDLILF